MRTKRPDAGVRRARRAGPPASPGSRGPRATALDAPDHARAGRPRPRAARGQPVRSATVHVDRLGCGRIDGGLGADDAPRRRVLDGALPRARDGIFAFLLFMTRIVGRREPSSLEPFDLILLIVIGDLVQQGVTQSDHSVTGAILAAGTFGVLTVVVSYLSFRFVRLRRSSRASPMILLQDGKPIERNLAASESRSTSWPRPPGRRASPRSTAFSGPCSRPAAGSASSSGLRVAPLPSRVPV